MKPEDLRIDESVGDVYKQAIDHVPGYSDQEYLKQLRKLALSGEVPTELSHDARNKLADIAFEYGAKKYAFIIRRSLADDTNIEI